MSNEKQFYCAEYDLGNKACVNQCEDCIDAEQTTQKTEEKMIRKIYDIVFEALWEHENIKPACKQIYTKIIEPLKERLALTERVLKAEQERANMLDKENDRLEEQVIEPLKKENERLQTGLNLLNKELLREETRIQELEKENNELTQTLFDKARELDISVDYPNVSFFTDKGPMNKIDFLRYLLSEPKVP